MRFRRIESSVLAFALAVAVAACGGQKDGPSIRPDDGRFVKTPLAMDMNEPVDFAFLPDGRALVVERGGAVFAVDPAGGGARSMGRVDAHYVQMLEFGASAIVAAPDFAASNQIYVLANIRPADGGVGQAVLRYDVPGGQIDPASKKVILQWRVDETCCHTGGGLVFDKQGRLYVSTGDNTDPFQSDGFGPIDAGADRAFFDALRSSGHTNDLRGKVLRIEPKADGSYASPADNLFPNGRGGRPEIYAMGFRNPYTLTIDHKTGDLYVGDVGPDANEDDPERGPRGHDEINRIAAPGNFGWPLVIADNRPYRAYDFATKTVGAPFDVDAPINASPRNTGARVLPPAQPALIAYPYAVLADHPGLGAGGRNALVGGVYRMEAHEGAANRYPAWFDGKLMISDFIRGWLQVVELDKAGGVASIERFAPHIQLNGPLDLKFGPDGALYVLEYGFRWFEGSSVAGLSRIDYTGDANRPPRPVLSVSSESGATRLRVKVSAEGSSDPDGDALTYAWVVRPAEADAAAAIESNEQTQSGETALFELAEPGEFHIVLEARDGKGGAARVARRVVAGNTAPDISLAVDGNRTVFWPDAPLTYKAIVRDAEQGALPTNAVQSRLRYESATLQYDLASLETKGRTLVETQGCITCHQIEEDSAGPAYARVARRYAGRTDAFAYLSAKIASGGAGVWGETAMPAHGHLSQEDLTALSAYVLSQAPRGREVPLTGVMRFVEHAGFNVKNELIGDIPVGVYLLSIGAQDAGAGSAPSLAARHELRLRPSRILLGETWGARRPPEPFSFFTQDGVMHAYVGGTVGRSGPGLAVGRYDLQGVGDIIVGVRPYEGDARWRLEIRRDASDGPVLASGEIVVAADASEDYRRERLSIPVTSGEHDLFLAATLLQGEDKHVSFIDIELAARR